MRLALIILMLVILVLIFIRVDGQASQQNAPTCEAQPSCGVMRDAVMAGLLEIWISKEGRAWRKANPLATKTIRRHAALPPKGAGVSPTLLPVGNTAFGRGIEALLLAYKLTRGEGLTLP